MKRHWEEVRLLWKEGDASVSQEMPEVASRPPEVRREAWHKFSDMVFIVNQLS